MNIQLNKVFETESKPKIIVGPCSAETREQVLSTAQQISDLGITPDLYRAGIWKPRTRPNAFEGVGAEGLKWLQEVRDQYGWKITTEVANKEHVFAALKAQVDVLWIGARTTVNPFSVQEVADALQGVDTPVLIKNPINPDVKLWMGAVERIYQAGISRIGVIHRGFSKFGSAQYRNVPQWQLALELKREFPDIEFICDASHICGKRDNLYEVAQLSLDLDMDGIMIETHCTPDEAWSDASQQVTPLQLKENILDRLIVRNETITDPGKLHNLEDLREQIDLIDKDLMELLSNRMKVSEKIGEYKRDNNLMVYQQDRWNSILDKYNDQAKSYQLSTEFTSKLLKLIHQESINRQEKVMMTTPTTKNV